MKKIMIIGAGTYQVDLIKKAREKGLYTIVVSPGKYPGMEFADKVLDINILEPDKVLEAAKAEKIDGVTSNLDMAVYPVAYVAEKLGLPGNSVETVNLFRNKHLTREKCKEIGLPTIESTAVGTIDEAEEFFEGLRGPAIIKPVDACASKGVTKINTIDDLRKGFKDTASFSGNGSVIIEKFVTGKEYEVDGIAVNGQLKTLMYADLNEFKIPNVFASMTRLYPSVADRSLIDKMLEYDLKVLKEFGLWQGLTHSEYIVDDTTGEIYLIETAARGGGTFIGTVIAGLQTEIDTTDFLIDIALGKRGTLPDFETAKCHSGYVAFYLPAGEVVSVTGIDKVHTLPYVAKTTMDEIKLGNITAEFHDKRNRHAIILHASSRAELNERIKHIRSILNIKIKTSQGIQGPIWE